MVVCKGTYHEQVVITKPLSLQGHRATINQTGVTPTFQVTIPGLGTATIFAAVVMLSSDIRFSGFTVTNSLGEGILAAGLGGDISGISISHNAVVHNDLGGGVPPASTYFQCAAQGQVPGDCGEGVHFTGVAYSQITRRLHRRQLRRGPAQRRHRAHAQQPGGGQRRHRQLERLRDHRSRAQPERAQCHGPAAAVGRGIYNNVIRGNVVTNNGELRARAPDPVPRMRGPVPPRMTTWSRATTSPATSCPA